MGKDAENQTAKSLRTIIKQLAAIIKTTRAAGNQPVGQPSGKPIPKAGDAENNTAKRARGQTQIQIKNTTQTAGNKPAIKQTNPKGW